eukprot:3088972-Rhodomonas_salina.1
MAETRREEGWRKIGGEEEKTALGSAVAAHTRRGAVSYAHLVCPRRSEQRAQPERLRDPRNSAWSSDEREGRREGGMDGWMDGSVSYTHLTLPTICSV